MKFRIAGNYIKGVLIYSGVYRSVINRSLHDVRIYPKRQANSTHKLVAYTILMSLGSLLLILNTC
jgi:hypothetical protein